ncbi:heavy metal translocating P-type ATPase [Bacilliculturomica massiliensis]|uniref:heavy metal translocating P-type ATPase n=1 Tax=Bacilliculturomica massiliensis TaxID=1917867 RepID=UPI001030FD07|nr:heavy metal translocating P-type ATPase [Bacilliculturomica massiliensis]
MSKRQKKDLAKIIAGGVLLVIAALAPAEGYLRLALFLIPYLLVGGPVLLSAVRNIFRGQVFDENFLMALATVGAFLIGEYPEGVAVMLFYQVGELFQSYAVNRSRQSITELMNIRPDYANIERDGELVQVDPEEVRIDDLITVKAGEKIPLDGLVVSGNSMVDTSALTGESVPRSVSAGTEVLSGCVNQNGLLVIRVTKEFGESTVSKILDMVENASSKKAKAENFITRFARYYTPAVVIAAAALALIPPLVVPGAAWADWIQRALIFLVISCPCALVISIPLGFFGGIGGASKSGVLVKGSNYLEAMASAEIVVFDKTGTLTKGVFRVTEINPSRKLSEIVTPGASGADTAEGGRIVSENALLEMAALAESYSDHPISLSLKQAWMERNTPQEAAQSEAVQVKQAGNRGEAALPGTDQPETVRSETERTDGASGPVKEKRVTDVEEIAGHGVKALVDGRTVLAGNLRLMQKFGVECAPEDKAGTVVYVARDGSFCGTVLISDEIKQDSAKAVAGLRRLGVKKTVMLSGDARNVAERTAEQIGLDAAYAELLPGDKVEKMEALMKQKSPKGKLLFVGDGINDAPVLAQADVGVAMGGLGSDAAIEAADVVLMDDQPSKLLTAIGIARKTLRIVKQNIVFALGVKGLILILGAFGMANMWEAVFADVGVSVIAILNAMRALKAD